ncbi:MAG: hypothetical protein F4138_00545 [Acidimicrobiia bacterium]|nr:hypothetical protein [Acidimicrobiia bacterium]MYC58301.1 hypothetical protein [Acidimicrobiia bacterium]MYG93476.1 hypothetical protein [Acidimicrobiia bacterium]MYI29992.1 hypothetical protein [Acidimicrobiia bacterium]
MIRQEEVDAAKIEIIHPEVAAFQLDWLLLQVTRNRLGFHSNRESHYEAARDLLIGTLDLLRHMPTRALGVNHNLVLEYETQGHCNQLGRELVPENKWTTVLQRPAMARVEEQGERTDGQDGYIRVRIEPILDEGTKVLCEVNDHFNLSPDNLPSSTVAIVKLLNEEWRNIAERATHIIQYVETLLR